MRAPGAMVWDHSTSRVVSPAQPTMSPFFGFQGGTGPAGWITWNDGGAGSPNVASNSVRSDWIVGEPKESTITIVSPAPVIPRSNNGPSS